MNAEIHTLTGAYAIDALSGTERVAFEHHMAACAACAVEVGELRATAARLGTAEAVAPPAALKQQVLAAARRTRQLPPAPYATEPSPEFESRESSVEPGAGPVTQPATRHPIGPHRQPRAGRPRGGSPRAGGPGAEGSRTRGLWAAGLAAAACLLAAVVLGVQLTSANRQLDQAAQAQQQLDTALSVLSAPDAKVTTATATARGGTVTAVVSPSRGKIALLARGMPPLPDDRSYQLWLMGPSDPLSAGVLSSGSDPAPLVGDLAAGRTKIGITIEPRGGSRRPTSAPVAQFDLPV